MNIYIYIMYSGKGQVLMKIWKSKKSIKFSNGLNFTQYQRNFSCKRVRQVTATARISFKFNSFFLLLFLFSLSPSTFRNHRPNYHSHLTYLMSFFFWQVYRLMPTPSPVFFAFTYHRICSIYPWYEFLTNFI